MPNVNRTEEATADGKDQVFARAYLSLKRALTENAVMQAWKLKRMTLVLLAMAFLLGRATILDQMSPFAIAFFAVIYFLRKDLIYLTGLALVAGSIASLQSNAGYIVTEMLVFLLIQRGLERFERADISFTPLLVFVSTFLVQLFAHTVELKLSGYTLMLTGVEALLSLILTLIFIQSVPVFTFTRKKQGLRNEEIICLIIMLASVMTGSVGWSVQDVTFEHVMSRYLILVFALVGGAPLGASVGVITGLILSLADMQAVMQMSLLAFAGMLAGLLKEGNRLAVAFGMLLGSSILTIYLDNQSQIMTSTWESLAAIVLFLLTPRSFVQALAKYVPGTQENLKTHYDYAKRVREVTAARVMQFSEVFRQLSRSFLQLTGEGGADKREQQIEHFMTEVSHRVCTTCWKRKQCWNGEFYQTYKYMTEMMSAIEKKETMSKKDVLPAWKQTCVRTDQVLDHLKGQFVMYKHDLHWKKQIADSRRLVADQLTGVSQVMEDLAKEIKREGMAMIVQEEQIRTALEELGLSIQSIDIISLDEGNVEIEIVHRYRGGFDECRKIVAPLLSDILGENIVVKREQPIEREGGGSTVTFGSAKEFEVETGVAGAAKGGDLLSGDSFTTTELGNGKFVVALSDGMGNGERARAESSAALTILKQLLQSGMNEKLAVQSVNSVLMLRSVDEMFATVDMALIDLYNARTTFLKIGSTPSFIKRGGDVLPVTASNLPVGILDDIDVDLVSVQLLPGDMLIMMTDGVFDAPGIAVNKELWMKRVVGEIHEERPQEFADCLLERVVRHMQGDIIDDMTILVARIEKYQPAWSTFRWPGMARLERPKTVS